MRRPAVLILMLLAMLWQSVAMARVGSTANVLAGLEHTSLHWQDTTHHHHEDGAYHLDDSTESVQHMLGEQLSVGAVFTLESSRDFPRLGSSTPGGLQDAPAAHPFLDGLLRPPRSGS